MRDQFLQCTQVKLISVETLMDIYWSLEVKTALFGINL